MANGYYRIESSTDDAECSSSTLNNATTYLKWGNLSGTNVWRTYLRFQMDIPVGAIIDKAEIYVYQDIGSNSVVAGTTVELIDSDNQAAFTDQATVWGLTNTHSVAWADVYGSDNTWRIKDVTPLVQAFIRRPGYASGNYMGIRIRSDGEASAIVFQSVQVDYGTGHMRVHLFVAWHHDGLGQKVNYWEVAGTDDDTWNSTDDANDNTSATAGSFGQSVQNNKNVTDCFNRTGLRWAINIPAGATVNNAFVVICATAAKASTSVPARVGVLTAAQTTAFTSNEFDNLILWNGTGSTAWSDVPVQTAAGQLDATPDIATAVQTRVQDGTYTPTGSDPDNYVAVSLADNGDQSAVKDRTVSMQDNTTWPGAILVAKFSHSSLINVKKKMTANTGSFMMY